LKSDAKTFAPRTFIQEYVPKEYKDQFREHLVENGIALTAFKKDIEDIQSKLKRCAYQTTKGGIISVPAEIADIVVIRPDDILVKDRVEKVK
jgi:hypothetical protein